MKITEAKIKSLILEAFDESLQTIEKYHTPEDKAWIAHVVQRIEESMKTGFAPIDPEKAMRSWDMFFKDIYRVITARIMKDKQP